jgi:DNA-binding GntR family transcriptional regulator
MSAQPGAESRPRLTATEFERTLRTEIVRGRFVPGQRLVETDLAEEFDVSRGHIRNALATLTVEGLVERVQNRGARVRAFSVDEAVEIIEVRGAVEALCASKAARSVTEAGIAELRSIGEAMTRAVAAGDREWYSQQNRMLHAQIIETSGQRAAAETIERLRSRTVSHQFRLARRPDRPTESLPQHLAIIDAISRRDPDGAARAMRSHLEDVARAIRAIGG